MVFPLYPQRLHLARWERLVPQGKVRGAHAGCWIGGSPFSAASLL